MCVSVCSCVSPYEGVCVFVHACEGPYKLLFVTQNFLRQHVKHLPSVKDIPFSCKSP